MRVKTKEGEAFPPIGAKTANRKLMVSRDEAEELLHGTSIPGVHHYWDKDAKQALTSKFPQVANSRKQFAMFASNPLSLLPEKRKQANGERDPVDMQATAATHGDDVARARFELSAAQGMARPSRFISDRIKAMIFPRAFDFPAGNESGQGAGAIMKFSGQGSDQAKLELTAAEHAFLDALSSARANARVGVRVDDVTQAKERPPEGGQSPASGSGVSE
jgi:hypothetical protein